MATQEEMELQRELGFGNSFVKHKVLTIDNGADVAGTGATGHYITKEFKDGQSVRNDFAPEFNGVILFSRVMLEEKGYPKTWLTNEFNSLNKNELIAVLALVDGKMVKDSEGNYKRQMMTFAQIQEKFSYNTPKGVKRNYDYNIILYVYVIDTQEVVKVKFKGGGRQSFFDYSSKLQRARLLPFNVVTVFKTEINNEINKYFATFETAVDQDGVPLPVPSDAPIAQLQSDLIATRKAANNKYILGGGVGQQAIASPVEATDGDISADEIPFE